MLTSYNPLNGTLLHQYTMDNDDTINNKLTASSMAQVQWKQLPLKERSKVISSIADILLDRKEKLAQMATDEMGKHIRESRAEVEKCAATLKHYATHASQYLEDIIINTEASKSYITYNPLGVVLAIMPWNFPYWQVFRAMAPILLSGNGMILKHASNVSGCANLIEEIVTDSALPDGLFQWLKISSTNVAKVIEHPVIQAVTLTGSTQAGSAVASVAARYIKKQVLELGGSDAYVILADADIETAVSLCVTSRMQNTGQSCVSAKRIIIVEELYDRVHQLLKEKVSTITYGNPNDDTNNIGIMVHQEAREELHKQVQSCVTQGARLTLGGEIPEGNSSAYPPTILCDVKEGMVAWEEELFGPVFILIKAKNEEDAIYIANQHKYGLGGAVFSQDINKAENIAAHLMNAGIVTVNDYVRSDARLPFGGVKQSGYGRELSHLGMHEFCNVKTVYVK